MGRTKTIADKEKTNAGFQKFMATLEVEAKAKENAIQAEIDALVVKHYANGWDYARLFGNKQSDYQNYDDWSMDRIVKIIDSIGNALKGGNFPSAAVPGSKDAAKNTVDEAKDFIMSFANQYDLIIARVQAMVGAVMTQFSVASNVAQKIVQKDMPLAGGLHLFFGSNGSVYTENTFFTNQFIGSFQIVFETYMSVKEAQTIAIQQILETTEVELNTLNTMILSIRKAQKDSLQEVLKTKPQDYKSTYDIYKVALDTVKLDRDELQAKYDEFNDVATAVDTAFDQLRDTNEANALRLETFVSDKRLEFAQQYLQEKIQAHGEATKLAA